MHPPPSTLSTLPSLSQNAALHNAPNSHTKNLHSSSRVEDLGRCQAHKAGYEKRTAEKSAAHNCPDSLAFVKQQCEMSEEEHEWVLCRTTERVFLKSLIWAL
jgi:hypothetical protein